MAKLEILSPSGQHSFNNPPNLSPDEQVKYFLLPPELATWVEGVTNLTNKVGFILLWGYSQAGVRFYKPEQFRSSEINAVCQQYNLDSASVQMADYNQRTFNYHKQVIRQHIRLKAFDDEAKEFFLERGCKPEPQKYLSYKLSNFLIFINSLSDLTSTKFTFR